jgi:flagellar FliL protein
LEEIQAMSSAAAEEKTEASGGAAAASSAPAAGGNKLVLILTLVNTLVTVGIIAILLVSLKQQKSAPTVADIKTQGEAKAHGEEKVEGHGEKKAEEGHGGGGEHGAEHGKAEAKKPADFGKMVTLEQFTVNLSTPGSSSSKFVRVNVSLEVANDDTEAEVTAKMPQIRNVIIDLFNSKRVSDLSTVDGRDYLREEIKNALNGFLVHGKVKGVFFTNFMLAS